MNWRLRLFCWLIDIGAPLAMSSVRVPRGGIEAVVADRGFVMPTPFGWFVARILGIAPQRIKWDVAL